MRLTSICWPTPSPSATASRPPCREDAIERRNSGFPALLPTGISSFAYGGTRVPDVVGNIKYTGTWGTAQLSGAVHQLRSANLYSFGGFASYPDTDYGFAVTGQVGVNLPMLAPGDAMWLAATYANGALGYITGGQNNTLSTGDVTAFLADAYVNPVTGNIVRGKGWSIAGGLRHYWTPQIRQNLFGSYARFDYGGGASSLTTAGYYTGLNDFNELRVGTNLIWQPVSGLDLGVEAIYVRLDPRGRILVPGGSISEENSWEGRVRIQRDF